ncbi:MAG: prepilin-type N-terminal cleavage/methylation domain-containing protein [Deltaproteobacteria bacterium]|nr:prepilin-type N-terminal cleavage/methylation domain-containing protein [Deltaproteobacteria bacterium]
MKTLRNKKGFTLLEILVATTLLATALLGMAGLTAALMQGNTFSNRLTVASTLAQDQLEQMTKLGYGNTAAVDTTVTEDYNTITGHPFYKRITTTDVDNPAAGMKTITVTVSWDSDMHSVAPQTILTQ